MLLPLLPDKMSGKLRRYTYCTCACVRTVRLCGVRVYVHLQNIVEHSERFERYFQRTQNTYVSLSSSLLTCCLLLCPVCASPITPTLSCVPLLSPLCSPVLYVVPKYLKNSANYWFASKVSHISSFCRAVS